MSLKELRDEYRARKIGPKILHEVYEAVRDVARRYDPKIYGGASTWADAEEDIVQSVVTEVLIREGQLDYIMSTALALADAQNLLRFHVRRYLARQRRRSVVDNLLDRAKELLRAPTFEASGRRDSAHFWLSGETPERRDATEEEILAAARSAAHVPRIAFAARDRAPIVYSRENLETLLTAVAGSLPTWFSLHDLAQVLELVLTDWVASFLYELEGDLQPTASLGPEEQTMAEHATTQILEQCTDEQLLVLRSKLENVPDQDIATELGISRPTVIARKKELFDLMGAALADLSDRVQLAVMERISLRLSTHTTGSEG